MRACLRKGSIVAIDDKPVDYAGFVPRVEDQVGHTLLIRYRRGTTENATRVQVIADRVEGRTVGRIKILVGPPVGAGRGEVVHSAAVWAEVDANISGRKRQSHHP